MLYLGKVVEYNAEMGYGYLSVHASDKHVRFYAIDFPKEGGQPKKGEKIKYIALEQNGVIKASQIIRLDVAMSEELKQKKANVSKQKNILKKSKNDRNPFSFISIAILVIFSGLVYLGISAWSQYKNYQNEQQSKFVLLEQQHKQAVEQQRKEIGYVKPIMFSDKSKNALNETTKNIELELKSVKVENNQLEHTASTSQHTVKNKENTSKVQFKCDGRTHCSQMRSLEEAVFFIKNCPNTKMDGNNDGVPCERQFKTRNTFKS